MTALVEDPGRAAWALTGEEILAELDALHHAQTRLAARRLDLLRRLDELGHAKDLGARDTVELLSLRHRLDPHTVRRDLRTAKALPRYPTVTTQLPGTDPNGGGAQLAAGHLDAASADGSAADATAATATAADASAADATAADAGAADAAAADETAGDGVAADGPAAHGIAAASTTAAGADVELVAAKPSEGDHRDPAGDLASMVDRRRRALARETILNPAQAAVITEILEKAPPTVRPADLAVAETELVIAARTIVPRDLRRLGAGVMNALDPDGPTPRPDVSPEHADRTDPAELAHAAETLWFTPGSATSPTGAGGRIRGLRFGGFMTGENAELFQTLIDAAAKPRKTPTGELDPRTLGQRRADGFNTVLRAAASVGGEIPAHGGIKPHLSITIPYAALTTAMPAVHPAALPTTSDGDGRSSTSATDGMGRASTTAADRASTTAADRASATAADRASASAADAMDRASASAPGRTDRAAVCAADGTNRASTAVAHGGAGTPDRTRGGEMIFGEPLPARDVRRIACDAGVIPIVLGTASEPLDVGRENRLVTPALRRALIARDNGCVIPGCGAPPGHCDAHHLTHWADGGATSIDNLALVCPIHHRAIHRGTWTATITNSRVHITRPAWTNPNPTRRSNPNQGVPPSTGPPD